MKSAPLVMAALLGSTCVFAAAINPGQTNITPDTVTTVPLAGTNLFFNSAPLPFSNGTINVTGDTRQAAYKWNSGTGMDFFYQVNVTSGFGGIARLILQGFTGWNTDVKVLTNGGGTTVNIPGFVTPTASGPTAVDRSTSPGDRLTWKNISLSAGESSAILIVSVAGATGYTQLTSGGLGLSANDVSIVLTDQLAPTPEPGFYAAVTLGLAGLFFARRRRS